MSESAGPGSDALAVAIEGKLQKGYWVESQSETEARVIRLGRKRWFGLFGGRVPETREIVRVDERGRTSVELLPERRY
jgi:hypothetical protein